MGAGKKGCNEMARWNEQGVGVPRQSVHGCSGSQNSEGICQEGIGLDAMTLQEETLKARDCGISGSYGRKGTNLKNDKRQEHAGRELQERVGVHARRRTAASPTCIFCFTLDKVGVLKVSRSVTQKINLALAWRSLGIAWRSLSL